jgi:hypothetical protein
MSGKGWAVAALAVIVLVLVIIAAACRWLPGGEEDAAEVPGHGQEQAEQRPGDPDSTAIEQESRDTTADLQVPALREAASDQEDSGWEDPGEEWADHLQHVRGELMADDTADTVYTIAVEPSTGELRAIRESDLLDLRPGTEPGAGRPVDVSRHGELHSPGVRGGREGMPARIVREHYVDGLPVHPDVLSELSWEASLRLWEDEVGPMINDAYAWLETAFEVAA